MYVSHSTQQLIKLDNGFAFIAFLEHVSYPVSLFVECHCILGVNISHGLRQVGEIRPYDHV